MRLAPAGVDAPAGTRSGHGPQVLRSHVLVVLLQEPERQSNPKFAWLQVAPSARYVLQVGEAARKSQ